MTEEQKNILHERFEYYESKSTVFVLIVFTIIVFLQIYAYKSEWIQSVVQVTFSISLALVFFFIIFSFLKGLLFPIIAKFYFKEK
jgi:glucan phosphoethanolaminetransferase (alkaline phosphatase superfamily)